MIGTVLAILALLIAVGILLSLIASNWLTVAVVLLAGSVVFGSTHIVFTRKD